MQGPRKAWVTIPLATSGGHELITAFTVDSSTVGQAKAYEGIQLYMAPNFRKCEDTKVCLKVFGDDSEGLWGTEAQHIRNSNRLQKECLETNSVKDRSRLCNKWHQCLDSGRGNHKQKLIDMLYAADVDQLIDDTNELINQSAHDTDGDFICINPETEDVESWECDCYDGMVQRCQELESSISLHSLSVNYTKINCLRALICEHQEVCQHWKARHCLEPQVAAIREIVNVDFDGGYDEGSDVDEDTLLLAHGVHAINSRASHSGEVVATEWNHALSGKLCN